jgi:hypothetical protein
VNISGVSDAFAAFFAADRQADADEVTIGLCDRIEPEPDPDEPVPFALTDQAAGPRADDSGAMGGSCRRTAGKGAGVRAGGIFAEAS